MSPPSIAVWTLYFLQIQSLLHSHVIKLVFFAQMCCLFPSLSIMDCDTDIFLCKLSHISFNNVQLYVVFPRTTKHEIIPVRRTGLHSDGSRLLRSNHSPPSANRHTTNSCSRMRTTEVPLPVHRGQSGMSPAQSSARSVVHCAHALACYGNSEGGYVFVQC